MEDFIALYTTFIGFILRSVCDFACPPYSLLGSTEVRQGSFRKMNAADVRSTSISPGCCCLGQHRYTDPVKLSPGSTWNWKTFVSQRWMQYSWFSICINSNPFDFLCTWSVNKFPAIYTRLWNDKRISSKYGMKIYVKLRDSVNHRL